MLGGTNENNICINSNQSFNNKLASQMELATVDPPVTPIVSYVVTTYLMKRQALALEL